MSFSPSSNFFLAFPRLLSNSQTLHLPIFYLPSSNLDLHIYTHSNSAFVCPYKGKHLYRPLSFIPIPVLIWTLTTEAMSKAFRLAQLVLALPAMRRRHSNM